MKVMEEEKEKLQNEIDTMNSVIAAAANISDDDIIKINAEGKIISALRSTLCLVAPDTLFASMFSGRWDESLKRDDNGCVFLNHDPELVELIVNCLRTKEIEDPSSDQAKECPKIPVGKEQAFRVLLDYFGLTGFFYPLSDLKSRMESAKISTDEIATIVELLTKEIEALKITVDNEIINKKKKQLHLEYSKFVIEKKQFYNVIFDHFKYLKQNPGTKFGSYFDISYEYYAPGLRGLVDGHTKFTEEWLPIEEQILRKALSDMKKDSTLTMNDVSKDRFFGFRSTKSCYDKKGEIEKDSAN